MMRHGNRLGSALIGMVCLGTMIVGSAAHGEPGVLLIAHGSPSAEWNRAFLDFGRQAADKLLETKKFKVVRTAFLEMAEPTIAQAVAELESAGCTRIIAVPVFAAPSGHSLFDVPAALGIYTSPTVRATFAEEGIHPAQSKIPILLTHTLDRGDLLLRYALDQVRKLSRSANEEAVVFLIHGSPEHQLLLERLLRRVSSYCCGQTGISYADWVSVGVGQGYAAHGIPTIQRALEHKKRVLVVGLYVGLSAANIHRQAAAKMEHPFGKLAEGQEVVFSNEPILKHPECLQWIEQTAFEALGAERAPRPAE